MIKQSLWACLAILLAWSGMDFILHGVLLRPTYEATASLWRPADQMNTPLIFLVTGILILCFVLTYGFLVRPHSMASGLRFGALFGLALSTSAGFGSYIHMPIPLALAWAWFLGGWAKGIAAGAILGALMKPDGP